MKLSLFGYRAVLVASALLVGVYFVMPPHECFFGSFFFYVGSLLAYIRQLTMTPTLESKTNLLTKNKSLRAPLLLFTRPVQRSHTLHHAAACLYVGSPGPSFEPVLTFFRLMSCATRKWRAGREDLLHGLLPYPIHPMDTCKCSSIAILI